MCPWAVKTINSGMNNTFAVFLYIWWKINFENTLKQMAVAFYNAGKEAQVYVV